jgi:hypothetical protein
MTSLTKKLIPAALVLTTTSGCGPSKCDPNNDVCRPDGGYYCSNSECGPEIGTDGGVQYDPSGEVICLC